jgi:uncharacterized membrane protein YccC
MASNRVASNRMRWSRRSIVVHSARTGVATLASFLVARLFRLPEAYWAPITTIVITQSSLGAAWEVSWQRFVGTLIGAALGIAQPQFSPQLIREPKPLISFAPVTYSRYAHRMLEC